VNYKVKLVTNRFVHKNKNKNKSAHKKKINSNKLIFKKSILKISREIILSENDKETIQQVTSLTINFLLDLFDFL
jgi:hypothetical protein